MHDGALRQAIHQFKYRGRRELSIPLGQILVAYWQEKSLPADLVVPVPLHASRQQERGYNQSTLLAGVLAERVPLILNDTDLIRTRATAPQVGLAAMERRLNVQDAFAWRGAQLDGIQALLIDDVCTTGATLGACGLALREAGAVSVWALTLARGR
jgi:ComF family protein